MERGGGGKERVSSNFNVPSTAFGHFEGGRERETERDTSREGHLDKHRGKGEGEHRGKGEGRETDSVRE